LYQIREHAKVLTLSYTFKEMSKDNYFFGVRAVDRQGHKSPVVYPRPGR